MYELRYPIEEKARILLKCKNNYTKYGDIERLDTTH